MKSFDNKPSTPKAIEIQRANIPHAMQAVTQKTGDYFLSNQQSSLNHPTMIQPKNHSHGQLSQQRTPMMVQNNAKNQRPNMVGPYGNQSSIPPSPPTHQQKQFNKPSPPQSMGYNNSSKPLPTPNPSMYSRSNIPGNMNPNFITQNQPITTDSFNSPPHSPSLLQDIRKILFSSTECNVFHWHNQTWYAAEGQCVLEIRLSNQNGICVSVQFQNSGQLYLNAWILPNTVLRQPSPTDVNISLFIGAKKENYLIHFNQPNDAQLFANILHKAHQDAIHDSSMSQIQYDDPEPVDIVNVPQTLNLIMQCKAKLFIQNETNNWSTFGGVSMRIFQQAPSMRMMIEIENDKTKLVSAVVKSGNVEKINSKRISFLLADEVSKTSIVYMIHLREDQIGNKIYEYLRIKNAENGW